MIPPHPVRICLAFPFLKEPVVRVNCIIAAEKLNSFD